MLQLKERGAERYDWGGLFADESTPERAGINAFKKAFGGRQERSFECTVPVTVRGRLVLPLRDAWRRATGRK
jgi:lipid II:glycine glycyltransferase (peptidoglycan interpeptide bridge formation enzyme)